MGFGDWVAKTFSKSTTDIITSLGDAADRFIQTKEEKAEFKLAIMRAEQDTQRLVMEGEKLYFADRQNARDMYMKDSSLQKIFAIVFLVFYCVISMGMIGMVISMAFFSKTIPLPEWGVMLITSVFTGMSVKVNTIVDFLFGGSKQRDDSDREVAEAFKDGNS